jgi:AmmeMemoRadiSam system protein A
LLETVADFAVAAAVEDNRFSPVTARELPGLRIEISVLSPMERVPNADSIQPKVHGVLVRRGRHQGLFLPQVWEHFSSKEDFMDELCRQKAHLPARAWQDPDTELYTFTVFAFEE